MWRISHLGLGVVALYVSPLALTVSNWESSASVRLLALNLAFAASGSSAENVSVVPAVMSPEAVTGPAHCRMTARSWPAGSEAVLSTRSASRMLAVADWAPPGRVNFFPPPRVTLPFFAMISSTCATCSAAVAESELSVATMVSSLLWSGVSALATAVLTVRPVNVFAVPPVRSLRIASAIESAESSVS